MVGGLCVGGTDTVIFPADERGVGMPSGLKIPRTRGEYKKQLCINCIYRDLEATSKTVFNYNLLARVDLVNN